MIHLILFIIIIDWNYNQFPTLIQNANWADAKSIYDFNATDIDGNDVSLDKYRLVHLK